MSIKRHSKKYRIESDPILRAFCVNADSRIFDVSGFFTPISIKDQMIRSCWIIQRTIDLKIISNNQRLLIIGAGPAGIVASLKAKKLGFTNITIVEKSVAIASILRNARRNVDFVQYDWSAPHWDKIRFPIETTSNIPFTVETNNPRKVASDLNEALDVDVLTRHKVKLLKKIRSGLQVEFAEINYKPDGTEEIVNKSIETFDMAISCAGFGSEIVEDRKSKFCGFTFWGFANHSIYSHNDSQKILVCGGGDGALQDFLLLATNKENAKKIYEGLEIPTKIKEEIENNIFVAEESSTRAQLWLNREDKKYKAESCKLFEELHELHKNQVKKVLANASVKRKLREMLNKIVLKGNLELAFSCNHFSKCYPLNRFLVLLIAEYLTSKSIKVFKKECRIEIESADSTHSCNSKAEDCAKYKHKALFIHQCRCTYKSIRDCRCVPKVRDVPSEDYDKIFLRFGINKINPVFGIVPALPGMQILPYSI